MPTPHLIWHSVTIVPQTAPVVLVPVGGFTESADDQAIGGALNTIQAQGGTIVSVLPFSGAVPLTDLSGYGHYYWVRVVYTTVG